ncbi:putative leucine-rich repeat receptor-like serine/threonine-protein kinase [Morus notabilis]|uniref:Putative leucine-rich repeat receptor-like serine/threonine-protein kinase n=2 Tax=Morus notabilis TaxID=981085 RepID=W9SAJ3_9ROSA|nr:putative leucine-rich repeat receptor-like serine/threonine-protein kinase [Morus notabilis]
MATNAAQPAPAPRPHRTPHPSSDHSSRAHLSHASSEWSRTPQRPASKPSSSEASTSNTSSAAYTSGSSYKLSSDDSIANRTPLSSLHESLPEKPHIYDFKEICSATNNFLAKRYSSSSSTPSWRCVLRGKEVIVFQRKFRREMGTSELKERLSVICRSHHTSIVKLLGASVSGDHIYLVFEFLIGANLADCLRNPRNPTFTVLSTWMSRMQIATDLAHGLDYIHNKTGLSISLVHNHIKSSSVLVTEPSFNAKICHFGTAQLCGEIDDRMPPPISKGEIAEVSDDDEGSDPGLKKPKDLERSGSGRMQFAGVMGYMSPEFQSSGVATQESDVFAFGVVILELLSSDEPMKYKFDRSKREFVKTSLIESANAAVDDGGGRLRQWMDRRLKDSFPVDAAEKLTRVALECVHVDPDKRPNMGRVAGKISKLYLESKTWSDNLTLPTDFSVSLAPR